jgi:CRP-like cAMP-binding protein
VAPLAKKYFGPGKRPALDKTPFLHLLEADSAPVELDPARVWSEIQERLLEGDRPTTSFLDSLPERAVRQLAKSGFLLKVHAGNLVTRQGTGEREMYVVLEGAFQVVVDGRRVALLERGDIFGEIAFFTTSGERTASVRALTQGRVLVLRRKFVLELNERDPEAGAQLLMSISRIMAERMAGLVRAAASASGPLEPETQPYCVATQ